MQRSFLVAGACSGALAVCLGAFAAHALKQRADAATVNVFHTGVEYQFYHAFALLAVGMLYERFPGTAMNWAGWCFVIGTVLFSGSLYAIALLKATGGSSIGPAGIITPIGGLFFIVGWVSLLVGVLKGAT